MPKAIPGLPNIDPWKPPKYSIEDIGAIQALQAGTAMPHQQQNALKLIVETIAGYYEISFRPGVDGDRIAAFAEGKRYVGQQIVKLTRLDLAKLRNVPREQG